MPAQQQTSSSPSASSSFPQSETLAQEAERHMPGGVNSPVRAFRAVGGHPLVFSSAEGCHLHDVDGNSYVDFVGSWGPMILGHAHPSVIHAVTEAAQSGLSFGATSPREIELAAKIKEFFPSIEMLRLTSSGTEACMSALRVARGFTGKAGILKFEGCYHGHSDCLLAKAGSGALTLALPDSAGIPPSVTQHTYTVPYNDLEATRQLFRETEIGAIMIEPVAGNMGLIPPLPGFLEGLRDLCDEYGAVLIFDEVMTGFRLSAGGAQGLYKIKPDMTVLGKIVGGGMPLAAYGGRADIMAQVAPLGPVYQAGTLSGNPVATAAGLATLLQLQARPEIYPMLEERGAQLQAGLEQALRDAGVPGCVQRVGSMWTLFFTSELAVENYAGAKTSDTARFARFFQGMLRAGYYLPPSQFEAAFLGAAHGFDEIEGLIATARKVLLEIA